MRGRPEAMQKASDEGEISGLRRRLWVERAIFVVLLAGLLAFHFGKLGVRQVCVIAVDGHPTAVVVSRSDANRLLDEIKKSAGVSAEVTFSHKVTLHSVSAAGERVLSDAEAMTAMAGKLEPVVQASAILVNGELVIGLPTSTDAIRTLSKLIQELSPNVSDVQATFKESVKIEDRQVPADRFAASAEAAVEKVLKASAPKGRHEVKPGETGWKIALLYRVPVSRLAAANPEVDLGRIHAGEKLTIPGDLPPITVVARKEVREELGPGVSKTTRITYENGAEVSRDVIGREHPPESPKRRRHRTDRGMGL
jgi:LysM repeat protein